MGPIIILDKSTLQGLSIDESVWLENFFLTNITPLLYVETLGDLALVTHHDGRPAETIIKELSVKTPVNSSHPNVHHMRLVIGDLLGQRVEMSGRPVIDGGITKVTPDGEIGVHFSVPQEVKAMSRWHKGEFLEIEREFSKGWRQSLSDLNFDGILGIMNNVVPKNLRLSNLNDIKRFVDNFTTENSKYLLLLALDLLNIPDAVRPDIIRRWKKIVYPSFDSFSPYAAFVLKIDLLFYIGMLRGFISHRKNNKVDLSYLYYLPFCHVFVSNDNLHERLAPLFMRSNQSFIKGSDLKDGLHLLDEYYTQLPDEVKETGTMKFAVYPPKDMETAISKLWDKHCPQWRTHQSEREVKGDKVVAPDKELLEHLKKVQKESITVDPKTVSTSDEADHIIFTRRVPVQKGKWRILPKGIENQKPEED